MRIQHNIMAMNAYRNYNNNNKALSGNLEKLSSGYKINRAGDDAAGLAISEKMRAQITGLNAAQKNVKDGISLVKTAEGAMQEIQDMLNRMDYLATQSANGTYDNEVDRAALQKEVEQLKSEIDRIADSANFNGIKLLDGTWDVDAKQRALDAANKELTAAQGELKTANEMSFTPTLTYDKAITGKDLLPTADGGTAGLVLGKDPANEVSSGSQVGTYTVLQTGAKKFVAPEFTVNFDGLSHTIKDATDQTEKITFTIGGTDVELTEKDLADASGKAAGETLTSAEIAKAVQAKIAAGAANAYGANQAGYFAVTDGGTFKDTDGTTDVTIQWEVKDNGDGTLTFSMDEAKTGKRPSAPINDTHYDVTVTPDADITGAVGAAKYKYTSGAVTQATATTATEISFTYKDADGADKTYKLNYSPAGNAADGTAEATAIAAAINADTSDDAKAFKALFTVGSAADKLTFEAKKDGDAETVKQSVTGIALGTGAATGLAIAAGAGVAGKNAVEAGTKGYLVHGTANVIAGAPAEADQLASTTIDLSKIDITDGMKIKLGETTYTFAVGADSAFKDAENVIDMTDYKADDLKKGQAGQEMAANRLSQKAVDNGIFSVTHQAGDAKIGIKQLSTATDKDMTTMGNFLSYISISSVNTKSMDDAQKDFDAKKKAAIDAAQAKVTAAEKKISTIEVEEDGGKTLQLQIGDTSDKYNQLQVKIGSMKTEALNIADLEITDADKAAAAIGTIKNAINYVSSVRGDLGAYQNRLDHTANNLSVMSENIQDAESTIRDTDVAEEMMSYVKNNILVQSAQAMLAQANQVPQGVLQLLG